VRWQSITIAQLTYSINLILGFSVATLGFQIALLFNDKFHPSKWEQLAFGVSTFALALSVGFGIWCVINRLRDFRATTTAARLREDAKPHKEIESQRRLYEKLGERTWCLFWWQIGLFGAGIVFGVFSVLGPLIQKLV